ncbi:prepilin peptidase [Actinoallomurus iriomotensis]|uniref:Prepilin type IV endopeptidase peptidase domain-containing protein n=1 Tax=Actinoallomurus iriomotensis TaxID=478107 RepID=A0A9W6S473_9ACTN|nr:A24 family peptidase [Actinoallomurus iriomotensis]GLY85322.1 hypothetical protein Airi02_032510 [Actinoallomurus iriomotensis]
MHPWTAVLCGFAGLGVGFAAASLTTPYRGVPSRRDRLAMAVATGVAFGLLGMRLGAGLELLAFAYLGAVGVPASFVDAAVRRLPDPFTLPSYAVGAALLGLAAARAGFLPYLHALIGMAALWAFYFVSHLSVSRAIGMGDVKFSGVIGLYLGWCGAKTWMLGAGTAYVLGALFGVLLITVGRAGRRTTVPFGPFMFAGALTGIVLTGG